MTRKAKMILGYTLALIGIGWLIYWGIGFCVLLFDYPNANYLASITFTNNITGAIAGALIVIGFNVIRQRR